MSLRVYVAFSGNNSGTYTLLGSLEATRAEALCDELREVFAAQQRWVDARGDERGDPSPLYELAQRNGIRAEESAGAWDDWPMFGPPPEVACADGQVMVFVPYTASFPALVGELIYRRGGRVQTELNHAHNPVVMQHTFWRSDGWQPAERAASDEAMRALEHALSNGSCDALYAREGTARPIQWLRPGFWPGQRVLVHCPEDPAQAMRAMSALARELGLRLQTEVFESIYTREELLGRRGHEEAGGFTVVLWAPGTDRDGVALALSLTLGADVSACVELVARAPVEVLRATPVHRAVRVRDALRERGAEAEVLGPSQRGFADDLGVL